MMDPVAAREIVDTTRARDMKKVDMMQVDEQTYRAFDEYYRNGPRGCGPSEEALIDAAIKAASHA